MRNSDWLANRLLEFSRYRGELLTPLKLQKLMFYADAWRMVLHGEEFTDEKFQAWVHGPVAVSQFYRFRDYKWRPIDADIPEDQDCTEDENAFLSDILNVFGTESALALERMTHAEQPWLEARGDLPVDATCSNEISKETTKSFYGAL